MSENTARTGLVAWHEIVTHEVEKAVGFYTGLFGWTVDEMDMGPGGKYSMFKAGEMQIGGVNSEGPADVPAHWITYFTVADVDAAVEFAKQNGAQILVPGTDIPEIGRFACVMDSQGAVSCPFKGLEEMPDPDKVPPCAFVWEELMSHDPEASVAFYRGLYGWEHEAMDMGGAGKYHIMKSGEKMIAGIMQMPPEAAEAPSHWIPYIGVEDVDASAHEAEGLGAKLYVPPRDIPEVGRFAVMADTLGATVALFKGLAKEA